MNVYDTANKLAQEIKESQEYKEYKSMKDERNADDSNHQQQAGNNIFHADQKSAANQPNNIEQ